MKWAIISLLVVPAIMGQVHMDVEGQSDGQGGSKYLSAIVTEQVGGTFYLQRFFPKEGGDTRYELGIGRVWTFERAGPCRNLRLQPYTGWAREGNGNYLLTSGVASLMCGNRKVSVIVDRKNLLGGDRGSFQYNRLTVGLYKFLSFRWDTFVTQEKPGKDWDLAANQLGGEMEGPVGKGFRAFATVQYNIVPGRLILHFGFRF